MTNKPAPFISFEGGEGSGKTTQIKMLSDWLVDKGCAVHATREPGGTVEGKSIRALVVEGKPGRLSPRTETLLYMADRSHHIETIIVPNTEKGVWVLSDRFVDSTFVYQSYARGLPFDEIKSVYDFFAKDFEPDMTILLDIDPEIGLKRAAQGKGRNLNEMRFESLGLDFHRKIREGYLDMAAKNSARYAVVSVGDQDPDAIHAEITTAVQKRFHL